MKQNTSAIEANIAVMELKLKKLNAKGAAVVDAIKSVTAKLEIEKEKLASANKPAEGAAE